MRRLVQSGRPKHVKRSGPVDFQSANLSSELGSRQSDQQPWFLVTNKTPTCPKSTAIELIRVLDPRSPWLDLFLQFILLIEKKNEYTAPAHHDCARRQSCAGPIGSPQRSAQATRPLSAPRPLTLAQHATCVLPKRSNATCCSLPARIASCTRPSAPPARGGASRTRPQGCAPPPSNTISSRSIQRESGFSRYMGIYIYILQPVQRS